VQGWSGSGALIALSWGVLLRLVGNYPFLEQLIMENGVQEIERSPLRTLLEDSGLTTIYCPACHAEIPAGKQGLGLDHLPDCPLKDA